MRHRLATALAAACALSACTTAQFEDALFSFAADAITDGAFRAVGLDEEERDRDRYNSMDCRSLNAESVLARQSLDRARLRSAQTPTTGGDNLAYTIEDDAEFRRDAVEDARARRGC